MKAYKLIYFLSIVGIGLALYLLYSYFFHPSFQPCSINAQINCDAAIKGSVSTLFGIPTALYGLIGYILILVGTLRKNKKLILGMSTFGVLFCLRITFIEIFQIKVYCPVCLTCQVVMLVIWIISLKLMKTS